MNYDFTELNKLINNIKKECEQNIIQKKEIFEINKIFSNFFDYNCSLLYIDILKEHLKAQMKEKINNKKLYVQNLILELSWNSIFKNFIYLSFGITNYQHILRKLFLKNYDNEIISILNGEIHYSYDYSLNQNTNTYNISVSDFSATFRSVDDLLKYEFFKVLKNNLNIIPCSYHNCNNFFIFDDSHFKYCSSKCRKKNNDEELMKNPYYKEKYKTYRKFYDYYKRTGIASKQEAYDELNKIYNIYKDKPINDKNLKLYKNELNAIKYR